MSEIKPALTEQEWKRFPSWGHSAEPKPGEEPLYHRTRHGIAAANLHEQPFGFTREDVTLLRKLWDYAWERSVHAQEKSGALAERLALDQIADRIEALLPPEENHGATQSPDTDEAS